MSDRQTRSTAGTDSTDSVSTYSVRTEPVQEVSVRTTESQYPLLPEAGPPDDTKDRYRVDRIVVGYNDL